MALFDKLHESTVNEAIRAFELKGGSKITRRQIEDMSGEGIEDVFLAGYGAVGVHTFNQFYNRYINKAYESEIAKITEYKRMAENPEIADVIEDATNESIIEDDDGYVVRLEILDDKLSSNENITKNLYKEFHELFYEKLDIETKLWDFYRNYLIDGRLYYERVIKKSDPKAGIHNIKMLPSDTMDFEYDPITGRILTYYQYLSPNVKRPQNRKEAESRKDIVIFNPEQIGHVDYGVYGRSKTEVYGYLEKAKVPYNQLKLLETSVIIYRIVRAPERLVFKIDTGQMPKDKAMKFVEKIKQRFIKKQAYDPTTGRLTQEPEVLSILENFWLPTSSEGRGSSIETVGGQSAGFTELDDVYYFARKLYRALKYPLSRVTAAQERQESEQIFGGSHAGEISRDEIKWAKFLERQQNKICKELKFLFLLHLEFRGIKRQYELSARSFKITMPAPSHYKDQMEQAFQEQRFNNYNALANNPEFSKWFMATHFLRMTEEDLKENRKGLLKMDKKYFPPNTNAGAGMDMGGGMDMTPPGQEGEFPEEPEEAPEEPAAPEKQRPGLL
jgi:hypothetical protein